MVANQNKFQLMFFDLKGQRGLRPNINENKLSATEHVKLLGIELAITLKLYAQMSTKKPVPSLGKIHIYLESRH